MARKKQRDGYYGEPPPGLVPHGAGWHLWNLTPPHPKQYHDTVELHRVEWGEATRRGKVKDVPHQLYAYGLWWRRI